MNTGLDAKVAAGRSDAPARNRALRILLADDDRDTVQMLAAILGDEGHLVHGVYTGRDVLPATRIFRPDAMILDLNIPGLSGYAVAQTVRYAFTDLRRPLVIAISGVWTEMPDKQVGQQVGFDHHLAKPADPHEVLDLLEPLCRRGSVA